MIVGDSHGPIVRPHDLVLIRIDEQAHKEDELENSDKEESCPSYVIQEAEVIAPWIDIEEREEAEGGEESRED